MNSFCCAHNCMFDCKVDPMFVSLFSYEVLVVLIIISCCIITSFSMTLALDSQSNC
jgi:hypothetical protein